MWELKRADGALLRCMIEAQRAEIPDFSDGILAAVPKSQELFFMVFTNLTDFFTTERSHIEHQRLQTAKGMIAEMAHEVNNPLTVIKSAGELLAETAATVAHQRRPVTGSDWAMINSICNVISDETSRLDRRVQYLVDCAAKDPEKLLELSRTADQWMERLPLYGKRPDSKQDSDC